jgi:hypothetical protein
MSGDNKEISISGLLTLALTGSPVWFYDEALTIRPRLVSGELIVTSSGCWVEVTDLQIGRTSEYGDSDYEIGYVLPYTLILTETKGENE